MRELQNLDIKPALITPLDLNVLVIDSEVVDTVISEGLDISFSLECFFSALTLSAFQPPFVARFNSVVAHEEIGLFPGLSSCVETTIRTLITKNS